MYMASFMEQIGGVKTLILVGFALLIAWYLRVLSRREKAETAVPVLDMARLAATPDDQLVDTVVRRMLADCEEARRDAYHMTAVWSNPQVNVYSVWVTVKEHETQSFAVLAGSPSGALLELAAEGFAQIGAQDCGRALTAQNDTAFSQAVANEQPLALCVTYIRDHAQAFVTEE